MARTEPNHAEPRILSAGTHSFTCNDPEQVAPHIANYLSHQPYPFGIPVDRCQNGWADR